MAAARLTTIDSNHDHARMVVMGENTIYDNILEYIDGGHLDSGCDGPRGF